nr:hypothetical protein BaRGS_031049 [Batillaria attramentaria]
MYEAYMGNLSELISAVLVSATNDEELKKYELEVRDNYRALIYDELFREGLNFAAGDLSGVDPLRLQHVWSRYEHINKNVFAREYLDGICDEFAREFMVVHRVSRVLRKCGQYQDLMLLSEGDDEAYTYTDPEHYGKQARPYGQPLFHDSEDVENIFNRRFDYTLVLDGDTGVTKGSVFELLEVAAANPERGIIQPAIKLHCADTDTMFMHLEAMRQAIYEPMTNALTAMLGQSSFFGKGLIKNRIYIDNVIGTRENLIERVPVDVLSHDTFEAALLRPLYCGSVFLLEAPSYNYVTWNIRERRWNRGEVLLSMYFWKNLLGKPMRWIQSKLQGDKFNATKLRTESKLDFTTSYVAHSALRQMFMKPLLLVYIIIHYNTYLLYRWASIIVVMFLVLVFPKFATCNRHNYKFVLLETVASFLQFTPEAMVGCVRIAPSEDILEHSDPAPAEVPTAVTLDNEGRGHKKGMGITHWDMLCGDFNVYRGKVSWWYDWEAIPSYWTTLSQFSNCGPLLENRAAMIWNWPSADYVVRIPTEASVVLGYNEPNHKDQGCRVDYIATHIYQCNADREMAFLEKLYHKYNKKIWVTEFACPRHDSLQAQMNYMKAILPRLEAAPFVVRYAWFITRWKGDWFIPQGS